MCYSLCAYTITFPVAHVVAAVGFLSRYLNGRLPYVRRHVIVNKNVLNASLNKTIPSFLLKYKTNQCMDECITTSQHRKYAP